MDTGRNMISELEKENGKAVFFGQDPAGFFLGCSEKLPERNCVILTRDGSAYRKYAGFLEREAGMDAWLIAPGTGTGHRYDPLHDVSPAVDMQGDHRGAGLVYETSGKEMEEVCRNFAEYGGHCADETALREISGYICRSIAGMPPWRRSLKGTASVFREWEKQGSLAAGKSMLFLGEDTVAEAAGRMKRLLSQMEKGGTFQAVLPAGDGRERPLWLAGTRETKESEASRFRPHAGNRKPWALFIAWEGGDMAAEYVMLQAVKACGTEGCTVLSDRMPRTVPLAYGGVFADSSVLAGHDEAPRWAGPDRDGSRIEKVWAQKYLGYGYAVSAGGSRPGEAAEDAFRIVTGSPWPSDLAEKPFIAGRGTEMDILPEPVRSFGPEDGKEPPLLEEQDLEAAEARHSAGEDVFTPPNGSRGGRPKGQGEKRLKTLGIRMTDGQYAWLKGEAARYGMSAAAYMRWKAGMEGQ